MTVKCIFKFKRTAGSAKRERERERADGPANKWASWQRELKKSIQSTQKKTNLL